MEDVSGELLRMLDSGDIGGVVALIRRGAERGERLAALRPGWEELGRQLLIFRAVMHQVVLEEATDPLAPLALRPSTADSPQERGAITRRHAAMDMGHALVEQQMLVSLGVLSDQLYGLAALMVADPPIRPAFVIGRVLLDAASALHFLLDPEISPEARSVRAANLRLEALHDELLDHAGEPEGDRSHHIRAAIADLLVQAESDGVRTISRRGGGKDRLLEPRLPPRGTMAAMLLGDLGHGAWRTLSSTVHAQDRPVLDLATGRGDYATSVNGRSVAALQLGASVLLTTEAVQRAVTFRGQEHEHVVRCANDLNLLWAKAAGMNDAEYSSQVDTSSE